MAGEVPAMGTRLAFLVYCDKTGLGAMNCSTAPAAAGPVKPLIKAPGTPFAAASAPAPVPAAASKAPSPATAKEKEVYLNAKQGTRHTISPGAIPGEVTGWTGLVARIRPYGPVPHPSFKGEIDCHKCDVQDDELPNIGAQVKFHVCLSGVVLGAERLTVTKQAEAKAPPKAAPKAIVPVPKFGVAAKAAPAKAAPAKAVPAKAQAAPAAQTLTHGERQRISDVRTTGEVQRWANNYGWIEVHAPLDSAKAKRDGTIFVGKSDLIGMDKLVQGQLVQFHVYIDSTGLGAEECSLF